MDILVVLQLSFERNLQHFHLVAQHLSLIVQRLDDFYSFDSPEAFVPDTIERLSEVDEIMTELLVMLR